MKHTNFRSASWEAILIDCKTGSYSVITVWMNSSSKNPESADTADEPAPVFGIPACVHVCGSLPF